MLNKITLRIKWEDERLMNGVTVIMTAIFTTGIGITLPRVTQGEMHSQKYLYNNTGFIIVLQLSGRKVGTSQFDLSLL